MCVLERWAFSKRNSCEDQSDFLWETIVFPVTSKTCIEYIGNSITVGKTLFPTEKKERAPEYGHKFTQVV